MAKASDNQFPKLLLVEGAAPAAPPAGVHGLFVDTADDKLKRMDSAGAIHTVEGAGGGGGGGGKDRRWTVPAGWTTVDEFDDDSLDAAWTRVDGTGAPAANVEWTEGGDVLSVVHLAGDTGTAGATHGLMRTVGAAVAVGDAFITAMTLYSPDMNYPLAGICLSNGVAFGSGVQVMAAVTNDTTVDDQSTYIRPWTNWNTAGAGAGTLKGPRGVVTYLRLVCTAANTWRCDVSPDGVGWRKGTATATATMTPTHVGMFAGTFGQSGAYFQASFEFLRRVSGIS